MADPGSLLKCPHRIRKLVPESQRRNTCVLKGDGPGRRGLDGGWLGRALQGMEKKMADGGSLNRRSLRTGSSGGGSKEKGGKAGEWFYLP